MMKGRHWITRCRVFHYIMPADDEDADGIETKQYGLRAHTPAELGHNEMPTQAGIGSMRLEAT